MKAKYAIHLIDSDADRYLAWEYGAVAAADVKSRLERDDRGRVNVAGAPTFPMAATHRTAADALANRIRCTLAFCDGRDGQNTWGGPGNVFVERV